MTEGTQYIGKNAFSSSLLPIISIPNSLKEIDENAFSEWGTKGIEQKIIIDVDNITKEEREQCGAAIIIVNTILVTYETNSQGNEIESERVSRKTNEVKFTIPEKEGYTFLGWYDQQGTDTYNDPSGKGKQISDKNGNLVPENLIDYRDSTFYAKWEISIYKITWEF